MQMKSMCTADRDQCHDGGKDARWQKLHIYRKSLPAILQSISNQIEPLGAPSPLLLVRIQRDECAEVEMSGTIRGAGSVL